MKAQNLLSSIGQSGLGILAELAYSLVIMLSAVGIIYLVLVLKWSSGRL